MPNPKPDGGWTLLPASEALTTLLGLLTNTEVGESLVMPSPVAALAGGSEARVYEKTEDSVKVELLFHGIPYTKVKFTWHDGSCWAMGNVMKVVAK